MGTYFVKGDQEMAEGAQEQKQKTKKGGGKRICLLDELRGFAVFCMVFYHAFYTIGMLFGWKWGTDLMGFFSPAEPFFAGLFIFISGICSNLSHSNIDRGAKLFFIAFMVTVVTYFTVGSENAIRFGILHMLSICMMFYGVCAPLLKYIPLWIGFALTAVLFVMTHSIPSGSIGIPFVFSVNLPSELYKTDFLYPLGFMHAGFTSSDYFPLLPWLFLFLSGTFFGRLASAKKFPKFSYKKHVPFFAFLGRHALIIYLAHQPLIFGICIGVREIINLITRQGG